MASKVIPLLLNVWKRANAKFVEIPIRLNDFALERRIVSKWTILQKIAGKNGKVPPRERQLFPQELDKLFNILTCNCDFVDCASVKCDLTDCPSPHINCKCPRESKIPKLDLLFIKDQRAKIGTKGDMQMALGDQKETKRQIVALKRKAKEEELQERKNREGKRRN